MLCRFTAVIFSVFIFSFAVSGAVTLPALFSDHAVLARHQAVPVFGKAAPGEEVTVSVAGQKQSVKADKKGDFLVELDLSKVPEGPHVLQVNERKIKDVLVGGVFLASGQSNMAFVLQKDENFAREARLPENPELRFFVVPRRAANQPEKSLEGAWVKVFPRKTGAISAVAYYFAKKLNQETGIPVGIIQSSVGGSAIEGWMSKENLQKFPNARRLGNELQQQLMEHPGKYRSFLAAKRVWEKRFKRQDLPEPHAVPGEDVVWTPLTKERFSGNGIVWLKNSFTLSPKEAASGFRIAFSRVTAPASLWIDGKKVAVLDDKLQDRGNLVYVAKGRKFTSGKHEVMIRFHASGAHAALRLGQIYGKVRMPGAWQMCREKSFGRISGEALKALPRKPGRPPRHLWSQYYNGMIYPLLPYRLTGAIWYQGESNTPRAWEYRKLFPALIGEWRKEFRDEALPFYFVMLAPYLDKTADAGDGGKYGDLRAAQLESLKVPHTGMAVISDAGEAQDIHPIDKKRPGERLAAVALKNIYGKDIPCESPRAIRAKLKDGKVTISFVNTYGGLKSFPVPAEHYLRKVNRRKEKLVRNSPDAQLEGFALADANGKWHWAEKAEISGENSVTVSSSAVPEPVKIRYNYSNNPTCNLFNQAGFPAAPFEFILK